jgi:nicotinate phosphoribosyltransferase
MATPQEIKAGEVTDVYFNRTVQILRARGNRARVKAEVYLKSLPGTGSGASWPGSRRPRTSWRAAVDVTAMVEGTVFGAYQPVLTVEGVYVDWAEYETALLGLLCQASGIATKAARCKKAAGERQVISFGARRMHPALAPMIERNAFLGGCDGVAVTKSAELIDADPMGTIPHALVLVIGDTVEALRAFNEVIDPKVRRVALIDTLQDEKFEAIRVAEALGRDLYAVRLDTPSSRRGDFYRILEEVRWELDYRGFEHVRIIASGGIDEYQMPRLNPLVDAYGWGRRSPSAPCSTSGSTSWRSTAGPIAKRGKHSGSKRGPALPRCGRPSCRRPQAGRRVPCGGAYEDLLKPLIRAGRIVRDLPPPRTSAEHVLEQLRRVPLELPGAGGPAATSERLDAMGLLDEIVAASA